VTGLTRWGRALDPAAVLPEYPRPQLVRDSYLTLNGHWDYAITPIGASQPNEWDGRILVPFSPEAPLSGVERTVGSTDALWYRRSIVLPSGFVDDRVILHFGAVDQACEVWVGGMTVGTHRGGYLPFSLDITDALAAGGTELVVRVTDSTDTGSASRGKQSSKRGGIWYTPQSGIWQSVWLESVPTQHIAGLRVTPDLAGQAVVITVEGEAGEARVRIVDDGRVVADHTVATNTATAIAVPDPHPWSPADPFLYDLEITLGNDSVRSYIGMRSVAVVADAQGIPRLHLNGEPFLQAGLLDQGYWPDGLYTAPSDEALVWDIQFARDLGFTMLRKHIKIEPARWYYHCDKLGMLVWQDMVNGGGHYSPAVVTVPAVTALRLNDRHYRWFGRADVEGRRQFLDELEHTIEHLRGFSCIVAWVPFNEGWGQFDALAVERRVRELDPTRLIDHASGWHDQGGGDLRSLHIYFRPFRVKRRWLRGHRALALTEFGGYSLPVEGHRSTTREFGYRRYRTAAQLWAALKQLWERELLPAVNGPLTAFVYTQLSDVEDEVNGLVTDDREVIKVPVDQLRQLNDTLSARSRMAAGGRHA